MPWKMIMIIVFIQVVITVPRGATIKNHYRQEYKYLMSANADLGCRGGYRQRTAL